MEESFLLCLVELQRRKTPVFHKPVVCHGFPSLFQNTRLEGTPKGSLILSQNETNLH